MILSSSDFLSSPLLTPPPLIYHCQFSAHLVCSPMCPTNLSTTVLLGLVFFFSILLYSALFSFFLFTSDLIISYAITFILLK